MAEVLTYLDIDIHVLYLGMYMHMRVMSNCKLQRREWEY